MSSDLLIALSAVLTMLGTAFTLVGNPRARRGNRGAARSLTLVGAAVIFAVALYRLATV